MPKLEIIGHGSVEVPQGRRLINAIVDTGLDIGHRCGGQAACTTCRVEFEKGEPERMTQAEHDKLQEVDLLGKARLACQIEVDGDMKVRPLMLASKEGWPDAGPPTAEEITPQPVWIDAPDA